MSFYSDLAANAAKLIVDKGMSLSLVKQSAGTYNAATGTVPLGAPASSTVYGVVLDYPTKLIDGSRIVTGDKKVIMSTTGATPEVGDGLVIGGVQHAVIDVKPLQPAGTPVIFTLQVRAGA